MNCLCKRLLAAVAGGYLHMAWATEATYFEQRFLRPGVAGDVDLSAFAQPARVLPGEYWLQVAVNQQPVGRLLVPYRLAPGEDSAQACLDLPLLRRLGVAVEALPDDAAQCRALHQWIAEAAEHLDFSEQRLALDIPQAWLVREPSGYVPADLWDWGVSTAFSSYDLSLYDVNGDQGGTTQGYAGFSSGVNLGTWQWRHQGNVSSSGGYQPLGHYLQRELAPWGAQLRVGQVRTQGDLLDAQPLLGLHLFSDERMLPASRRGFAPVVRGVARGSARVAIRQGDRLLREVLVPPGPYVIDDLYSASQGTDLAVTVTEADGSNQHFTVTNAAAPLALRAGQSRFGLSVGQLDDRTLGTSPWFAQGTWQLGVNDQVTAYTGVTMAVEYRQLLLGAALNTTAGAVGLDVARAQAQSAQGERLRLSYATVLTASDTHLGLAYQQATDPGYQPMAEAYRRQTGAWHERARASASLNQPLGTRWGQLNASAWQSSAWQGAVRQGYSLGYAQRFGVLSYSLGASREHDRLGVQDTVWQLSLSLPLAERQGSLSAGVNHGAQGSQAQLGLRTGSERFNYGATASASDRPGADSVAGHGGWREPFGEFSASLGQGQHSRQLSLGARGGVVAHPGGVTLSQPLAETFAVVQVPDAKGARVVNGSQLRVDRNGHAVVPHLAPYQLNRIDIDPKGLPLEVELSTNSQEVAPRAGAVAFVRYPTRSGRTAVIELSLADGGTLPFGAQVTDASGEVLGRVGQASRVLARGVQRQGRLHARWGEQGSQGCVADYEIKDEGAAWQMISALCLPEQGERS